jgi:hypothetical protein
MKDGIHYDIPWADYLAIDLPSPSTLKPFRRSAKRGKRAMDGELQPKPDVVAIGNAVHAMVSSEFDERFLIQPAFENDEWNMTAGEKKARPKVMHKKDGTLSVAGQRWHDLCKELKEDPESEEIRVGQERTDSTRTEYYEEAVETFLGKAESDGMEVLKSVHVAVARKMLKGLEEFPAVQQFIRRAKHEVTLVGSIAGIRCKTRVDMFDPGSDRAADTKTTTDIAQAPLFKQMDRMGNFIQFAFHLELFSELGVEIEQYDILAMETGDDYDIGLLDIPMGFLDEKRGEVIELLEAWERSTFMDEFPGMYPGGLGTLTIPKWAR